MYKYILFDLDGTLTDLKEGITRCVQYALASFGIDEDIEDLLSFIGPPLKVSFMTRYNFSEEKANLAIEKYRERFSEIGIFENKVYDGIKETLDTLKKTKKLAVATSKPSVYANRILEKYNLMKYFDVVVGSELDGTRSAKKEIIDECIKQFKINDLSEVIMIGDRKHDIIGANLCGIDSIGVRWGYAVDSELEDNGATYVVSSLKELEEILK